MQFFNRLFLCIKLKFLHLYEKFKINGKWLFPLFFLFLIPNVNASEVLFGAGASFNLGTSVRVDSDVNSLPFTFSTNGNGGTNNFGALGLTLSPTTSGGIESPTFTYLNLQVCTTANEGLKVDISNSSCSGSCLSNGNYNSTYLNRSGTVNNYSCQYRLFVIPIQKWKLDQYSGMFEVDSYFQFRSTASWYTYSKIESLWLSDYDISIDYSNQAELNNKLNSINTAITNMQNSINSNVNTNTQNIINNQNSNTNAINGNIDQEFNDLKNQDHTYNSNPKDTPSGSSDINSTLSKQDQLSSSLNLDSSNVVVTLNTNATSYIWGIVDRIRAVDSRIVLLFTTVLSLGIIKMILNR